ncbi:MAG: substrate-binding domain-containing protein [Leptolyngbyaceae cyanobacterium MO_188.B28]|nr:substrate-binding domain-containing protein [Leptolyngbyaceae cyanobacterium MO_188.B28]
MNKPQRGRVSSLALLGSPLLISVALIWTAGVLGIGVWRFIHKSSAQFTQADAMYPPETFAQVRNVPTGLFTYGGSPAWAPIRLQIDSAIQAERLEFQLRYVEPIQAPTGSESGIQMLMTDQLSLAQTARPLLDQEYRQAEQRGFTLKQIPIAIDGIAVAVNPELTVPGLTLDQLQGIYSGEITNWQAVGGPDLTITPYSRPIEAGGAVEFFSQEILGGEEFGWTVNFVDTTTQALRQLGETPGGIYYASAPTVVPQCSIRPLPLARKPGEFISPYQEPVVLPESCPQQRNQVNTEAFRTGQYPLTRYLYVAVKENGELAERAGKAYAEFLLTDQGQEAIARTGFVRIR